MSCLDTHSFSACTDILRFFCLPTVSRDTHTLSPSPRRLPVSPRPPPHPTFNFLAASHHRPSIHPPSHPLPHCITAGSETRRLGTTRSKARGEARRDTRDRIPRDRTPIIETSPHSSESGEYHPAVCLTDRAAGNIPRLFYPTLQCAISLRHPSAAVSTQPHPPSFPWESVRRPGQTLRPAGLHYGI